MFATRKDDEDKTILVPGRVPSYMGVSVRGDLPADLFDTQEARRTISGHLSGLTRDYVPFGLVRTVPVQGLPDGLYAVTIPLVMGGRAEADKKVTLAAKSSTEDTSQFIVYSSNGFTKRMVLDDIVSEGLKERADRFDARIQKHPGANYNDFFEPEEIERIRESGSASREHLSNILLTSRYFHQMAQLALNGVFASPLNVTAIAGARTPVGVSLVNGYTGPSQQMHGVPAVIEPQEHLVENLRDVLASGLSGSEQLTRKLHIPRVVDVLDQYGSLASVESMFQDAPRLRTGRAAEAAESLVTEVYEALVGSKPKDSDGFTERLSGIADRSGTHDIFSPLIEAYHGKGQAGRVAVRSVRGSAVHSGRNDHPSMDAIDRWATIYFGDVMKAVLSAANGTPQPSYDFDVFARRNGLAQLDEPVVTVPLDTPGYSDV